MEKINLVELLKDCPKGMELDCSIHNRPVIFNCVKMESDYPIRISSKDGFNHSLTYWGSIYNCEDAKCIIFPKGKTTWEGFIPPYKFKDGDVIFKQYTIAIISYIEPNGRIWYHCWYNTKYKECKIKTDFGIGCINDGTEIRFATKEEKEILFKAIEENGYEWDEETKTLKKLIKPKFKVGDKVRHKTTNKDDIYEISKVYDDSYGLVDFTWMIYMRYQDQYELVIDKFDVTTLKPFDKVLVRLTNDCVWKPKLFYYYDTAPKLKCYPFITINEIGYTQCIPYNGNEHLCRTTNNCDEFYRVWEE